MIKRLTLSTAHRFHIDWPPSDEDDNGQQLFSGRKPLRKIVVLFDADLFQRGQDAGDPGSGTITPERLLADLLNDHPLVDLYRYADEGPPSEEEPDHTHFGQPFYTGWAIIDSSEPRNGVIGVTIPTDNGWSQSAVVGNWNDVAVHDTQTDAYRDLPEDQARARRLSDALAAQVAGQAIHADLYVTERPYVHAAEWLQRGTTVCTPIEALALFSLYLRTQGEYLVAPMFRFNRGLFFWVGTREILPAAWRWFTACVQHSQGSHDSDLMILGGSLLQRVDRAIEARDAIHVALNQPQNNDLRDDALSNLDIVLLLLMGAIDVAARVVHRVLGLADADEHRAAWQDTRKNGWLTKVRAIAPTLAAVVDPGTDNQYTLTIVRRLRNSVHGAALQGLAVVQGGSQQQTLVGIPQRDEAEVLAAMDALGGREHWGVAPTLPGRSHVDPGILVDRLFEVAPPLLDQLMAQTPVERLDHVQLSPSDTQPPAGDHMDPFAAWIRQSIRWQLGL